MRPRVAIVLLVLVAASAAIVAAFLAFLRAEPGPHPTHGVATGDRNRDEVDERDGRTTSPTVPSEPERAAPASSVDRKHADAMRALLHALFADAGAPAPAGDDAAPTTTFGEMPPAVAGNNADAPLGRYVREHIRDDFLPLAEGCYKNLLAKRPRAEGKATVHFRIVGDRRVGGVVDEAKLDPGDFGALEDPEFRQCMQESMMSVSFDAPPGRREVTVDYSFAFTPD